MISIGIEGVEAVEIDFRDYPSRVDRALVRALNRGIGSGRTFIVREIARDTSLKSGDVRAALRMHEATLGRPEAKLAASLLRIPLIKFGARGPRPSRGQGRGVSYRLGGTRGRHPSAFIATMRSGHEGVFARVGKARLPIQELHGPSLGRVFAKFRAAALERSQESFVKNFDHEMQFRTSGDAAGSD